MRIALITHKVLRGDGQGRVNFEIARAALAAGHSVWLVASEVDSDLAGHPKARVVPIQVSGWPTALLANQVFAIKSALWLRRHRGTLDLVHVNGFITWGRADVNTSHFVHAAWLRSPFHTSRVRRDWYGLYQLTYSYVGTLLERWAYQRARSVVSVSEQVRRELQSIGIGAEHLRMIPNGVDTEEFRPQVANRGDLGLPTGPLLLFVGDIKTPRKNLDTLLRALVNVPGTGLLVVGRIEGSPYPALAARLGLQDRVWFLGYRRDIPQLMQAVDIFVFPSRYEACSLVLLEAAASGLPVVAAKATGGTELLTSECSVLLDNAEDPSELAAALRTLVDSETTRVQMGRAARSVALSNSWAVMARRYLQLYQECCGELQ
jgi:glycosyltransferase involved in cell wall biosynthesis